MLDNTIINIEYCKNIVDSVSSLLYYSHIPTALIALITGFIIFLKNKKLILSNILLLISGCFAIWSALDLVIWFSYDKSNILMFAWAPIEIFSVLMFILSFCFLYVFIYQKDLTKYHKVVLFLFFIPILVLSPTQYNIIGYDPQECVAIENANFSQYVLVVKSILSLWMVYIIAKAFKYQDKIHRKKLAILSVGILSFIFSFLISGILASFTGLYIIEIYGLMAMMVFILSLGRLVVIYGEFNIKIFSTQLLTIGLTASVAAQFAFIQNPINRLLNTLTVLLSIIFGWILTKTVKREVEQREKIEKLAKDLASANEKLKELDQMKSEFLSLATHQIRAPLTAIKGYSSMLTEGDFGVIPDKAKKAVNTIYTSCQNLIDIVGDFLNISRIEQGRMVYDKSKFDIQTVVKEVVDELRPNIENAGLKIETKIQETISLYVNADRIKIKQIFGDILDNSIKYTKEGSIFVSVYKQENNVVIETKDTGVGIDKDEIPKLFNKFKRSKDANKTNVIGTGLGLYISKKMIEAQDGSIHIFSEGLGKGSTFTMTLPLVT